MKYIVTIDDDEFEEIFIFPNSVNHNIMAEAISYMKGNCRRITRTPISAGFIEGGKCVGKSESLGLSSRPQDSELL